MRQDETGVAMPARPKSRWLAPIVFGVMGAALFGWGGHRIRRMEARDAEILAAGAVVQGKVAQRTRGQLGGHSRVEYAVDGVTYSFRMAHPRGFRLGAPIAVAYAAENPAEAFARDYPQAADRYTLAQVPRGLGVMFMVFGVMGGVLFFARRAREKTPPEKARE